MTDDIEKTFEGKTIEDMSVDTLRRYVLALEDRQKMQKAYEAVLHKEQAKVIDDGFVFTPPITQPYILGYRIIR